MESTASAPAPPVAAHTKQYVFVDEYNRHKRLKVMRACDGCRKRKIRCDGALQNGPWPCGACVRLKLKCIPPTLDQDDDTSATDGVPGQQTFSFQNTTFPTIDAKPQNGFSSHPTMVHEWNASVPPPMATGAPTSAPMFHHDYDPASYGQQTYQHHHPPPSRFSPVYTENEYSYASTAGSPQYGQNGPVPNLLRSQTDDSRSSSGDPDEIDATVRELSNQMGDLQIDITSEAPYITNAQKHPDAPAMEEVEVELPASVYTDSTVRIPPEMMPTDERVMDYFGYFFEHIHSYVPVLNRNEFYEQWRTARSSISPLLLEGIFACVARFLEEPLVSRKWLALAARHEETVKDVPRLSTIQALIVLLKARESISKRGYYYRSWMTVKYIVTMGFDLALPEHYEHHRAGTPCALATSDCVLKTRIWQQLFILEILVGAPLGRSDFSIEPEMVETNLPIPSGDVDPYDYQMSRRCTILAQSIRNIKESNAMWQKMKRHKKDWALDPEFVRHNEDMPKWIKNLPADFQLHYPEDGSPPYLGGDHYVAYMHAYHHLVVIMHHRPQLQALLERKDPGFKNHLDICLQNAAYLCRIQEALYRDFGFHGMQFMIRGVNFTIYCVLTCTMLHLAAITSPDPVLNSHARTFFTRHMRVLEHCLPSATAEMRVQINALREAFSADTSKAFELKPTLGLRSPTMESHSTPGSSHSGPTSVSVLPNQAWANMDAASAKPVTPVAEYPPAYDNITGHGMAARPPLPHQSASYEVSPNGSYNPQLQQVTSAPQITGYALEPVISNEQHTPVWDPSGIFNQWNTAFGGTQPPPQPSPPAARTIQQATSAPMMPNQQPPINTSSLYGAQQVPVNPSSVLPDPTPTMPTVTPVMWQDAFTNAYVSGHGQKRYREASMDHSAYGPYASAKRRG